MVHRCNHPFFVNICLPLAILGVVAGAACDRRSTPEPARSVPGEVQNFTGTWTSTGNRQTMHLGSERQASIFKYTGSLLLGGEQQFKKGFKAEILGFADSKHGMQGRCVWTDEQGEKVFSELQSEAINPAQLITGRFIGGTGRYAGTIGEYSFKWQRLVDDENGEVNGRVVDMKGWALLSAPASHPVQKGVGQ
jgi:hypothetical protein